jgi:predicted nucleic acid-binding protein
VIVLDASAAVEVLLGGRNAGAIEERMKPERIGAPHVIDAEVANVLRRFNSRGELTAARGQEALAQLMELGIVRYGHVLLLPRIWELRHNMTAFDAAYVALAEVLGVPLVTTDARLAAAPGHAATIELVA